MGFRQAYDSIHKESLYNIIEEFRIPNKFMALIQMCIKRTQYQVRVNGTLSEGFAVETNLKPGDILSQPLFNLTLEKAVRMMQSKVNGIVIN